MSRRSKTLTSGLTTIRDRVPMTWSSVEDLFIGLEKVIKENSGIQKIVLDATSQFVTLERRVTPEEAENFEALNFHDAIRGKPMDGYISEPDEEPLRQLFNMFKMVTDNDFEVCHVLISGPASKIFGWLKIPRKMDNIFGVPLEIAKDIPDDAFLVCGAVARDAAPEEIKYSVKGTAG